MNFNAEIFFLAASLGAALVVYALTAGADFGAGFWQIFARDDDERAFVDHAIAPIWEANHVWLIFIVVVMFAAFPPAFALLTTQLHVPLVLMLTGIVLRGTAFVFQAYDPAPSAGALRWRKVFAAASAVTPFLLGVCLGAVASGRVVAGADFISPWLHAFAFLVGAFVLALFALLAAVYLCNETQDAALLARFRARAIAAEIVAGVFALLVALAAPVHFLWHAWWLQVAAAGCAALTLVALAKHRFSWARVFVAAQVTVVIGGFLWAQYPALIPPERTFENSAAPESVLRAIIWATGLGALLLAPAFVWLFAIFKRRSR